MRVIVAVNKIQELSFRQTTALLTAALVRKGCDVWLASIDAFSMLAHSCAGSSAESTEPAQIQVRAFGVPPDCITSESLEFAAQPATQLQSLTLGAEDLILIRTNPGRDLARWPLHNAFLDICRVAEENSVRVVNSPSGLTLFANKSSLAILDAKYRPTTLVSSELEQICGFIRDAPGECVIKPLLGSRGKNVIRVSNSAADLEHQIRAMLGHVALMAQYFVSADHPGDRRIVTVGGKILEANGHVAGIERRPAANDFRANLHAGGTAHPLTLDEKARAAAEHAAELMAKHGIWLAGVDLIGDQIIELNVFSTGGLYDAKRFFGIDFADVLISRLLVADRH
jgi:glutathione synthase